MTRTFTTVLFAVLLVGCSAGMMSREQAVTLTDGMTRQQVVNAVGKPASINTTRTQDGVRQQWVYETPSTLAGLNYRRVYVYFHNGKVTAIHF